MVKLLSKQNAHFSQFRLSTMSHISFSQTHVQIQIQNTRELNKAGGLGHDNGKSEEALHPDSRLSPKLLVENMKYPLEFRMELIRVIP